MTPEQMAIVNGKMVTEYFNGSGYVVFLDGVQFDGPYEDAIRKAQGGA